MRILFLSDNYRQYYTHILNTNRGIGCSNYEGMRKYLYDHFFYHSDSYVHAAKKLGQQADQIIMDCLPLQDRWARENIPGVWLRRKRPWRWWYTQITKRPSWIWNDRTWKEEVLLWQIRDFDPDVIYVFSGVPMDTQLLEKLREEAKLLVCQWAAPLVQDYPYQSYDLIISASANLVEHFQNLGINSTYLKLAFDDRVHKQIDLTAQRAGVFFIGSILIARNGQENTKQQ